MRLSPASTTTDATREGVTFMWPEAIPLPKTESATAEKGSRRMGRDQSAKVGKNASSDKQNQKKWSKGEASPNPGQNTDSIIL